MPDVMCTRTVYDDAAWSRGRLCARRGVVEEDGRWWCRQHAPSHVRARYDTDRAARAAQYAAARALAKATRAVAADIVRAFTLDATDVRIDGVGESITLTVDAARKILAEHAAAERERCF